MICSDYSQQISNSFQYKFTDLVNSLNTDWLLAPIKRAPDIEAAISCDVAFNLLRTFSDASQITVLYYRYGIASSPSPKLKWPSISASPETGENEVDSGEVSFTAWIFEEFSAFIGFNENDVVHAVTQAFKLRRGLSSVTLKPSKHAQSGTTISIIRLLSSLLILRSFF